MVVTAEELEQGRAALARRDWPAAHRLLGDLDPAVLEAEDLEGLAEAAWAADDHAGSLQARQRAHAAYLRRGDAARAASAALAVAAHFMGQGNAAVARGWRTTAERLLAGQPESEGQARLLFGDAYVANFVESDFRRAADLARRAAEVAARVGATEVETSARNLEGRSLALLGDVDEGMAILDETAAMAMSGTLSPAATVGIACLTISTCQQLAEHRRAAQWIEAYDLAIVGSGLRYSADCRVHRAAALRDAGSWGRAEAEARLGCADESFDQHFTFHTGWGWSEIGEIRLRLGDLPGAEAAFAEAHRRGFPPHPGFALLRLAQGDVAAAASAIREVLAGGVPVGYPGARLLEAAVRIAVAGSDLGAAQSAWTELREVAERFSAPPVVATRDVATGMLALAQGDVPRAVAALRVAVEEWLATGMPFETARARLLLGRALTEAGDHDTARLELGAAQKSFAQLGAVLDEHEATAALRAVGPAAADAPITRVERSFMFTDIVRSTALTEAMGDSAWRRVLRRHDALVLTCVRDHHGRVVKFEGDGVFAVFRTGHSAVGCARTLQQRLAEQHSESFPVTVRIGLHRGPAVEEAGDYFGIAVNTAARIMSLAQGGEIMASVEVAAEAGCDAPAREVELVGLSRPVPVVAVTP